MDMATDMGMEEKTMVKRRKRNSFIILASTLLLTGCGNSNLEITKNDILEVARDDANATKKECSNVSVQEEKKYYTVSFDTTTGSYEYKIGKDGIIQERNYKRSNSEEVSTTEPVEEKKEETKTETKKEEKKESTSFDENQQAAIDAALANAGLGQEDVTDIGCTLDEATQQYTVTFTFQDIKNTCMVDAATFTVLSSIQG
jgi:preprotein translocase subunit SecD